MKTQWSSWTITGLELEFMTEGINDLRKAQGLSIQNTTAWITHLSRKVLLDEVKCSFVNHLVLVRLQRLDLVQSSKLLDHQAQFVRLLDLVASLQ